MTETEKNTGEIKKKVLEHDFTQRGIYLTFVDASVINSICKAILRHQMCPKRLPEPGKTKLPLGRAQGIFGA